MNLMYTEKKSNHRITFGIRIGRRSALGFRKISVGLTPFVIFCSTTFLQLLETYGFLYRNCKNVVYLVTLCAIILKIITKMVDK